MKFFNRPSVCRICRVHFEPLTDWEAQYWPDLCDTHRKGPRELHLRQHAVVTWATMNWQRLEVDMLKEREAERAKWSEAQQAGLRSVYAQQQAAQGLAQGLGLGNIFGQQQRRS
jgi:hypothetical protein